MKSIYFILRYVDINNVLYETTMRSRYLCSLLATICLSCKAQDKLTLRFVGNKSSNTYNSGFINNTFVFINDKDTVLANVKVPFEKSKMNIINKGLYYNCILKPDSVYTIILRKISKDDLPKEIDSYYKTNAEFMDGKGKYKEIKKDTKYSYKGYYERYVDINNVLYEITGLTPDGSCFYPH